MLPAISRRLLLILAVALLAASCGSSTESDATADQTSTDTEQTDTGAQPDDAVDESLGIRLVSADEGAAIQDNPPENLVVLDVRTSEEFGEGHLDGAVMLDFYRADFADQLAELDPDVPYLLYCRSGNRSGQTAAIMEDLGFSDVADVDGGIVSWANAGLPTVTG